MKIFVTGTRGIPNIPGGVEKHCQELFPRIASKEHTVFLATRSSYVAKRLKEWSRVKLVHSFAPRSRTFEAIIHTLITIIKARWYSPDILHIHGIGPALLVPLARLMGLRVVVTNHGPDYDRDKWGNTAKLVLRLGEKMGCKYANEVIVISSLIKDVVSRRCGRDSNLIYNGVTLPTQCNTYNFLKAKGLEPGKYVLAVARFVPEKGLHDLIDAFRLLQTHHQLVIAGDADHESDYSKRLRQAAANDKRIVLTGYITGQPLTQIYTHAALFVLPSYHEGLPIALLEAISYGLSVLASDIPANKEVKLSPERYFQRGNIEDLKNKMACLLDKKLSQNESQAMINMIQDKYNWDKIARETTMVYEKAMKSATVISR